MKYIRLYLNFVKNSFRRDSMYRFNFVVNMFTVVLGYVSNVLFFYFLYNTGIEDISGWSRYQVYILLATVWIIDSIFGGVFFFNLIRIPMKVENYDLDSILTKPVNPVFMISMRQFNTGLFAGTFFGAGFLIYTLFAANFKIQFMNIISYIVLILCGVLILFSVLFIMVTFSLRFVRIQGLIKMFWTMMEIGKNPFSIYPNILRFAFVFLIPAITIYNFPSSVLTDSCYMPGMSMIVTLLISVFVTLFFLIVSIQYFKKSLKFYYR